MHSVRQLELIRALARHRHFGRAATELGVSQPALTRSLLAIEEDLGVRLFDRDAGVSPTVFGSALVEKAETVIRTFAEMMREIAALKGLDVGELAVATGPYPADISVQDAFGLLSTRYPHLLLQLTIKNWPLVVADVLSGEVELGVADITEASRHQELVVEPLRRSPLSFFCRADHPLLACDVMTVDDVLNYPLVGPSIPLPMTPDAFPQGRAFGTSDPQTGRPRPRVLVETFSAAKAIVLNSNCLSAALPSQLAPELRLGLCVLVPMELPWLTTNYGFILKRGRTPSPSARALMELVRAVEAAKPLAVAAP